MTDLLDDRSRFRNFPYETPGKSLVFSTWTKSEKTPKQFSNDPTVGCLATD